MHYTQADRCRSRRPRLWYFVTEHHATRVVSYGILSVWCYKRDPAPWCSVMSRVPLWHPAIGDAEFRRCISLSFSMLDNRDQIVQTKVWYFITTRLFWESIMVNMLASYAIRYFCLVTSEMAAPTLRSRNGISPSSMVEQCRMPNTKKEVPKTVEVCSSRPNAYYHGI